MDLVSTDSSYQVTLADSLIDSSLMGAINAMDAYQKSFGLSGEGASTGIVFIIYNLG